MVKTLTHLNLHVWQVKDGVWTPGAFINPGSIDKWAIVNVDFRTDEGKLK